MIPSLRKKHRIIWIILGIVLPLLFIAAILVIPEEAEQEQLFQETDDDSLGQFAPKNIYQD